MYVCIYVYIYSIYILPLPPLQNEPLPDLRTRKEEAVRRRLERLEKGGGPSCKGCSVVHELQRVAEMGLEHVGVASCVPLRIKHIDQPVARCY